MPRLNARQRANAERTRERVVQFPDWVEINQDNMTRFIKVSDLTGVSWEPPDEYNEGPGEVTIFYEDGETEFQGDYRVYLGIREALTSVRGL